MEGSKMKDAKTEDGRAMESCGREGATAPSGTTQQKWPVWEMTPGRAATVDVYYRYVF